MKNLFKYIGIVSLMIFSFYYTNYIANFMRSKTELMYEIKTDLKEKNVSFINAVIDDDYIIPGLCGKVVNINDSYQNMLKVGFFDDGYLVYDEVIPEVSLKNNMDKIIKKANQMKKAVALIITDQELLEYSLKNNLKINYLITKNELIRADNIELINNDVENFYYIERFLNHNNINKNICVINDFNKTICQSNGKYLVEPTYIINNSNMSSLLSDLDNGDIIQVDKLSLTNYRILVNKLRYHDLKIDYLSNLISENYSSL